MVPVYETLPGWQQEITAVRRLADLPADARELSRSAEPAAGRPVEVVSVGPDREQTIFRLTMIHRSSQQAQRPDELPGVPPEKMPRHIAVIMDGNGRWARQRGLPRIEGHRQGVESVRRITEECARLGIRQLTLYCFSSENWKRPQEELDFLMSLLQQYMVEQRDTIMEHNIRVVVIGRREGLPEEALREIDKTVAMSRGNTGLVVCLAINYGARAELVDAVRGIAGEVRAGTTRSPNRSTSRPSMPTSTRPACPSPTC